MPDGMSWCACHRYAFKPLEPSLAAWHLTQRVCRDALALPESILGEGWWMGAVKPQGGCDGSSGGAGAHAPFCTAKFRTGLAGEALCICKWRVTLWTEAGDSA